MESPTLPGKDELITQRDHGNLLGSAFAAAIENSFAEQRDPFLFAGSAAQAAKGGDREDDIEEHARAKHDKEKNAQTA
jgi:hypothetical protein